MASEISYEITQLLPAVASYAAFLQEDKTAKKLELKFFAAVILKRFVKGKWSEGEHKVVGIGLTEGRFWWADDEDLTYLGVFGEDEEVPESVIKAAIDRLS